MVFYIVILLVIWAAAMAAWLAVSNAFRTADADKIKNRILGTPKKKEKAAESTAALFQTEQEPRGQIVLRILKRYNLTERLQEIIEQAGLKWNVARFVHACMGFFIAAYLISYILLPAEVRPYLIVLAIGSGLLPLAHVLRLRRLRLRAFEEIFPDSLEFVSRSMRAGHAFSVSLEMLHREFSEPLAGEFRRTFEEHNLGLPLDVALQKLAKRVPLLDVHFFVSAVLLQKRTGGNLAEILDKLAYVIRERFKLRGRIRAVSAHGRMTGIALTCIPLAVAVIMFYVNPEYVKFFFTDEVGQMMMGIAIALQLAGYLVIKKIVSIEV